MKTSALLCELGGEISSFSFDQTGRLLVRKMVPYFILFPLLSRKVNTVNPVFASLMTAEAGSKQDPFLKRAKSKISQSLPCRVPVWAKSSILPLGRKNTCSVVWIFLFRSEYDRAKRNPLTGGMEDAPDFEK